MKERLTRRQSVSPAATEHLRNNSAFDSQENKSIPEKVVNPEAKSTSQSKAWHSTLQMKKGDPDDPHRATESKPVWLPKVTDAVIVPGLAGCAAIRINVHENQDENWVLVQSIVFHSEGKVSRSMEAAKEINQRILKESIGRSISLEVFVVYNGKHAKATGDHAPVIQAVVAGLGIPINHREETIKSTDDFITVDMTGTSDEILARYEGSWVKEVSSEVKAYRMSKFKEMYTGATQSQLDEWRVRWGQLETIQEIDDFLVHVNQQKIKRPAPRSSGWKCYLTTACVQFAGLPDDCHELQTLRHFRDSYMLSLPSGISKVQKYYEVAPEIVTKINAHPAQQEIYGEILKVVRQCVKHIEQNENAHAMEIYEKMVRMLTNDNLQTLLLTKPKNYSLRER